MTKAEQAATCILLLEAIRTNLHSLSKMTQPLSSKASQQFSKYADELKDWREVLEEHIPQDYDVGK